MIEQHSSDALYPAADVLATIDEALGADIASPSGDETTSDVTLEAAPDPRVTCEIMAPGRYRWTIKRAGTLPPGLGRDMMRRAALAWAASRPPLPSSGLINPGEIYIDGGEMWRVIQQFDRGTFGATPGTYPALIRRLRNPRRLYSWSQPIDQYDAWRLVNPLTGAPDRCTFSGQTWEVTQADGAGNNVWSPGVFGWAVV